MSRTPRDGQIALVTGASRGIGRAVAVRLARDFAGIVLVARDPETLASAASDVEKAGARAFAIPLDLKRPAAAQEVVAKTIGHFGRIDALAAVAGAVSQADIFELDDAAWDDSLALKFHSMRRLVVAAWPELKARRGAVAITSGASALAPKPSLAAVGSINAFISAFAKALSERGIEEGVRVNAVLPGPIMTDRRRTMLARYAESKGVTFEEAMTRFAREAGIARYGAPEEAAEAYAWLLSPAAAFVAGAGLRIDGGEAKSI